MQSAQPGELRLFDRRHDLAQVLEAVSGARTAGFTNLNLDLIYGVHTTTLNA
ncbi:coproporphyrinogen III oxidase, partial [bacterium]|nr:coproporphyrinogen III oxidase [bacterium]